MKPMALLVRRAATAASFILASACVGEMQSIGDEDEPISEDGTSVAESGDDGAAHGGLPVPAVDEEVKAALRRDLGLTEREVDVRLAIEASAASVEPEVRVEAGDAFAGSWLDDVD